MRMKYHVTIPLMAATLVLVVLSLFCVNEKSKVDQMFQLNNQRIAEGYYMAEFEFKMVGILYELDKGNFVQSLRLLRELQNQLITGDGLIKTPIFESTTQELAFYKNRQNAETGAFMDDSYPLCTYFQPTMNVLEHIANLSKQVGQPVELNHPLHFLEAIDAPHELQNYLDDLSTVGRLVAKMPKTPNVLSTLGSHKELEHLQLFTFSEEWKKELIRWHWHNQDPETGYWGVRIRGQQGLINGGDLTNTARIIKLFADKDGRDLHAEFPLRYKSKMIETTLAKLTTPVPGDLTGQHEWSIDRSRCVRLLTDYLWHDLSSGQKKSARKGFEKLLNDVFTRFYIPQKGAFSLYADQMSASLDGTAEYFSLMRRLGFFSKERKQKIWGDSKTALLQMDQSPSPDALISFIKSCCLEYPINSVRLYAESTPGSPDLADTRAVIYPTPPTVLDSVDILSHLNRWLENTNQNIGNWVSKGSLLKRLSQERLQPVPVFHGYPDSTTIRKILEQNASLTVVGVDTRQKPVVRFSISK